MRTNSIEYVYCLLVKNNKLAIIRYVVQLLSPRAGR